MTKEFFERGKQIAKWADNNMTKDEALNMAIEVLWSVEEYDKTGINISKKAINACKEALEQPAQGIELEWYVKGWDDALKDKNT